MTIFKISPNFNSGNRIRHLRKSRPTTAFNNPKFCKEIGEQAEKENAWWHDGYNKAKIIQDSINNGTYVPPEPPKLYRDDGYLNLDYFHRYDDDGLI